MMSDKLENVKWFLTELANQDSEDIESNDIEIYGEDTLGRDGCFTVEITKVAQQAYDEIEQLQAKLKEAEERIASLECVIINPNWCIGCTPDTCQGCNEGRVRNIEALNNKGKFKKLNDEIENLKASERGAQAKNRENEINIDELQNVRRILERGLKIAQTTRTESNYIDLFQHGLDLLESAGLPALPKEIDK